MFNGLFDPGYKELKRVEKIANQIEALAEEVNVEGEDVYVIAAVNGDYENDGANIVFIVK